MPFNVACPNCRTAMRIQGAPAAQTLRCPNCTKPFKVGPPPLPAASPPPLPPPPLPAKPVARGGAWRTAAAAMALVVLGAALGIYGWQRLTGPPTPVPVADVGDKKDGTDSKPDPKPDTKEKPEAPDRFRPRIPDLPAERGIRPLAGATKAAALRRLHVLIVGDTNSKDFGPDGKVLPSTVVADSVRGDVENVARLFERTLGPAVQVTRLVGARVTRADVLDHYRTLAVGPDSGLVFYYSGHGAIERASGRSLLAFESGIMTRNEVLFAMRSRDPAFIAVLTDCCNTFATLPTPLPRAPGAEPGSRDFEGGPDGLGEQAQKTMEDLFLKHCGLADVTASEPGTPASCTEAGGSFTIGFSNACKFDRRLLDADGDGFVTWAESWRWTRDQTNAVHRLNPRRSPPDQLAHAFALPTAKDGDLMPPLRRMKKGVGLVTIRNNTKRVIRYTWKSGDEGTTFINEVKPGHLWMHSVTMVDGVVSPLRVTYESAGPGGPKVTVEPAYFIIETDLIRTEPELGTQYQFLSDASGKTMRLFSY